MDKHSLDVLEFEKIKREVKKYAATAPGKEIVDRLNPVADLDYVRERLDEVTAGKELLVEYGIPPFAVIIDLREIIQKAGKGVVLSSKEIITVRNTLAGVRNLKSYFREIISNLDPQTVKKRYSLLIEPAMEIELLPELEKKIECCIDDYGEVKASASKKLAALRSEMERLENKIRDRLESIIRGTKYQSMLQDSLITRRGDRYVVPVKHEYRNTFAGIVHDQSTSGLTLFMEPIAIMKLNNRLREIKQEEEEEIYRILQILSGFIQDKIEIIKLDLKIVSVLDVIFARASYSRAIGGISPDINNQGKVIIKGGKHPLLQREPVPIDISVGDNFTTLVITGSNTGGKTVALKTIGLFVLMVESGLHIPAKRGTSISIFNNVFADIGDEQSIEQNLSSFSSHINKIRSFLNEADQYSLVLLDELGVGTDPKEGAALGISILEKLKSRQVTTVVTTHYSQLKSYAYSQSGVENASVEFDLETLQPTYRLLMGVPGGSNAFAIALKLGIPEEIITEAKQLLTEKELKVENIIADLNRERKKYRELKASIQQKEKELNELTGKYKSLIEKIKQEEKAVLEDAYQQADQIIKKTRKEIKKIIQELKNREYNSRSEIDRVAYQVNQRLKEIDKEFIKTLSDDKKQVITETIKVGDRVRLRTAGQKGEVLAINHDKNEAIIQAGIMTITVNLSDLIKVNKSNDSKKEMVYKYRVKKSEKVSLSLDLRGERYETAQHKLDKYLDDVFLAGLKQVEIIHGKGTGALREAVKEVLKNNPHISSFRLGRQEEGGSGVTIVTINV